MGRGVGPEGRARFFELVADGWSLAAAAAEFGVARQSAWEWWRQSAPVTLKLVTGGAGALLARAICLPRSTRRQGMVGIGGC
jgi:hypothetical protein